ncbi:MAG TPA: hypothetical protein VGP07_12930 [Polyangia bacterium]|jgi:hypothetical protein
MSTKLRTTESRPSRLRTVTTCALVALGAGLVTTACGLRRELIEPPPVVGDGGIPGTDGGGACQWFTDPTVGCSVANLACGMPDACPATWQQAKGPTSCPAAGTTLYIETCGGANRWTWVGTGETLVNCYYDQTTGALQGIDAQNNAAVYCNGTSNQVVAGLVPTLCHDDAGQEIETITCSGAGTGGLTDGGYTVSCSQANPCHGGG